MIALLCIIIILCAGIDAVFTTRTLDNFFSDGFGLGLLIIVAVVCVVFDGWNAWSFWTQYDVDWSFQLVKEVTQ